VQKLEIGGKVIKWLETGGTVKQTLETALLVGE
jgi:hypothetical protein